MCQKKGAVTLIDLLIVRVCEPGQLVCDSVFAGAQWGG